jgi:N6-L-threonylcarbamoyladenine synthase
MIAYAGAQRMKAGQQDGERIVAVPRWPMNTLPPINEARSTGLVD